MTTRVLYMPALAETMKADAGKPYRPSNGIEGEWFAESWCDDCTKCHGCQIAADAFWNDIDGEGYPREWIINTEGQPSCTAFEEAA